MTAVKPCVKHYFKLNFFNFKLKPILAVSLIQFSRALQSHKNEKDKKHKNNFLCSYYMISYEYL